MRLLKLLSLPTAVFLCLVFALTAAADSTPIYKSEQLFNNFSINFSESVDKEALKEFFRQELPDCPAEIDISAFGVPVDEIDSVMNLIWINTVDLFNVDQMGYYSEHGIIKGLYLTYYYDSPTFNTMYSDFKAAAELLLEDIKDNTSLSDSEKALLLHDRLAIWCEYDAAGIANGNLPKEVYMAYGALVNRTAVCQGYAEAYMYLLEQCGIESRICQSVALNHAWNIVTVDGDDYHVDVTADDPVNDITGNVHHEYFMISTEKLKTLNRNATDYDIKPNSKLYDNAFWQNSTAQFCLANGEIYYVDGKTMSVCRMSDKKQLLSVVDKWKYSQTQNWQGYYTRLATDGKYLFYNTSTAVFEYNISDGTTKEIWKPNIEENSFFSIFGFTYEDGYLICDVFNTPNFTLTTKSEARQIKLYNSAIPKVSASVTNLISEKQTVTLNISGSDLTDGYYWGNNPDYTKNSYIKTSSKSIDIDISKAETYYYAVKSKTGRVSETGKLVFYKVELNYREEQCAITVLEGNTVLFPVKESDGYAFCGFKTTDSPDIFTNRLTVNKNTVCNAEYVKLSDITGVTLNKAPEGNYYVGDSVDDLTGTELKISLIGGGTAYAVSGFAVDDFDSSCTGKKTVNVNYYGYTVPFSVEIKMPYVKITITQNALIKSKITLEAEKEPADVQLMWSVSEPSVAEIGETAVICCGVGETTVKASFLYKNNVYSNSVKLSVICNHSKTEVHPALESTCQLRGHDEYTKCSICGKILSGNDTLFAYAGHQFIENINKKYMIAESNCVNPALYVKSCGICGKEGTETFTAGQADDNKHVPAELKAKEPTCSEPGHTAGVKCKVCGKILSGAQTIQQKPHTFKSTVTKPTCTDKGYTTYTCLTCKYKYTDNYVDECGHSYVSTVVPPECQSEGYTLHTCTVCRYKYTDTYVPKTEHEFTNTVHEADCTNPAYVLYTCAVCKYKYSEEIGSVKGHEDNDSDNRCDVCGAEMLLLESRADNILKIDNKSKFFRFFECSSAAVLSALTDASDMEIFSKNGEKLFGESSIGTGCSVLINGSYFYTVVIMGDIDGNGNITAADARLALRISAVLEEPDLSQTAAADFNNDGNVTAADARLILRKSAFLPD